MKDKTPIDPSSHNIQSTEIQ